MFACPITTTRHSPQRRAFGVSSKPREYQRHYPLMSGINHNQRSHFIDQSARGHLTLIKGIKMCCLSILHSNSELPPAQFRMAPRPMPFVELTPQEQEVIRLHDYLSEVMSASHQPSSEVPWPSFEAMVEWCSRESVLLQSRQCQWLSTECSDYRSTIERMIRSRLPWPEPFSDKVSL